MLHGEHLKDADLDRLVVARGVAFCRLWQHWLPRKVAWYYDVKKEPVTKPTALYVEAVRGGWKVDPSWPEFDEKRHTWAATAQAEQRRRKKYKARGANATEKERIQRDATDDTDANAEDECFGCSTKLRNVKPPRDSTPPISDAADDAEFAF